MASHKDKLLAIVSSFIDFVLPLNLNSRLSHAKWLAFDYYFHHSFFALHIKNFGTDIKIWHLQLFFV